MATTTSTSSVFPLGTDIRARIDGSLARYVQFGEDCPEELARAIRHSLLAPGKRLRPQLVLLAAETCGSSMEAALPAACAVEMVHTYSLIHDDLPAMDDDDLRRGRPSCHAAFGEATAILAGDALLARAFEVLSTEVAPPEVAVRCCAELAGAAGATRLVGGQADDLSVGTAAGGLAELEAIHRRKTGAMITASLRLGGFVAGADEKQLASLSEYGQRIGLAFQIVDDLLDYSGNEERMGKRSRKDLDRGKLTFPGILGVDESRQRAEELVKGACAALAPFGPMAGGLEDLARYVLQRDH